MPVDKSSQLTKCEFPSFSQLNKTIVMQIGFKYPANPNKASKSFSTPLILIFILCTPASLYRILQHAQYPKSDFFKEPISQKELDTLRENFANITDSQIEQLRDVQFPEFVSTVPLDINEKEIIRQTLSRLQETWQMQNPGLFEQCQQFYDWYIGFLAGKIGLSFNVCGMGKEGIDAQLREIKELIQQYMSLKVSQCFRFDIQLRGSGSGC